MKKLIKENEEEHETGLLYLVNDKTGCKAYLKLIHGVVVNQRLCQGIKGVYMAVCVQKASNEPTDVNSQFNLLSKILTAVLVTVVVFGSLAFTRICYPDRFKVSLKVDRIKFFKTLNKCIVVFFFLQKVKLFFCTCCWFSIFDVLKKLFNVFSSP